MALELIVEDGSGVENANSYVTLAAADDYLRYGPNRAAWLALPSDDRIAAIVQATRTLDASVAWKGQPMDIEQARAWPRFGVLIAGGPGMTWEPRRSAYMGGVGTDVVPRQVKEASMELAALMSQGDRTADPESSGIKSVNLGDSALEVEFDAATVAPMLGRIVPLMLSDFVEGGGRGKGTVPVVRV